jgi:hypothetical protein
MYACLLWVRWGLPTDTTEASLCLPSVGEVVAVRMGPL